MRNLPTGTVTFLFTDIEGSTRLLHALGDGYAGVLTDHRRLLRDAFARHDGVEVDTQGDSFFVAFADARCAVAAAVDAQTALARHAWPRGTEVRVRMGVHTGEPLASDGHYVGVDVHRGARIAAAAHGGQTLVSERTRRDRRRRRGASRSARPRRLSSEGLAGAGTALPARDRRAAKHLPAAARARRCPRVGRAAGLLPAARRRTVPVQGPRSVRRRRCRRLLRT